MGPLPTLPEKPEGAVARRTQDRTVLVALVTIALAGLLSCASRGSFAADPADGYHDSDAPDQPEEWLSGTGFEERRGWSSAVLHLGTPELDSIVRISDAIRQVPGVKLRPNSGNPWGLSRVFDGDRGSCDVPVYVNGARTALRDFGAQLDLDAFVRSLKPEALELHLGPDGPLHDPEGCGCLILWDLGVRREVDWEFVGSIRGRVRSEHLDTAARVRLEPGGLLQQLDSAGTFLFSGLLPGEYQLGIMIPERPVVRQSVRVYAFEESRTEIEVIRRRE